ncbi:MAG: hypothetical protein EPO39_07040 [Candidatus Manganitrophaceae bacterium]|nr:MAG: hypothetical protein EPO39_07040 [Candidatus Manganitrophaceae bacterium]
MGFLLILLIGLAAMILIARFGSKASGRTGAAGAVQNGKERVAYGGGKSQAERTRHFQEALISLLLKKEIITEEELLAEIELIRKDEGDHSL